MFNRSAYYNTRPDGVGVLEVAAGLEEAASEEQQFVPLRRTELRGEIAGPLASLTLVHTYGYTRDQCDRVLQALYRFPLPGDAVVTGVRARFGDVEIKTSLKPREEAEAEYEEAVEQGKQAALLTRESPSVFTLRVAGIQPDEEIVIETDYVQLARPQPRQAGWLLRVPLTTAPRYVREDELESRHAQGQPLALLRDPGHRFALDLQLRGAGEVVSPTHALDLEAIDGSPSRRIRLSDGEVVPDRDLVVLWTPPQTESEPGLHVHLHEDGEHLYYLAFVAPPSSVKPGTAAPREIVLLVDHSGSMGGAKWKAADWTVNSFLGTLNDRDHFALGLFHNTTKWFKKRLVPATQSNLDAAYRYLDDNRDSGGTNLGVALEQALGLGRRRQQRSAARHVLVVTDAQVSDEARLFRLADAESRRDDRRRISVICIDAAPNSFLANELAARGGGVSHFVTSNPDEEDVTTALEGVLADWAEPILVDLRLEVDRPYGEAAGRRVVHPGASTMVDLGDLPAGRALWIVGRLPVDAGDARDRRPLNFRLGASDGTIAGVQPDATDSTSGLSALKALFGARKLLGLEHLVHARYRPQDLKEQLVRLGYDPNVVLAGEEGVYAENALGAAQEALKPLLIEESLRYGIACSETAFIAVREEAGERVEATAVVASALPYGWSDAFVSPASGAPMMLMSSQLRSPTGAPLIKTAVAGRIADPTQPAIGPRAKYERESDVTVFEGTPAFAGAEAVLFDSAHHDELDAETTLTGLRIDFAERIPDPLNRALELLIYIGDMGLPRATVRLADLVRVGGERPLNLRRRRGERVRVALTDPSGVWAAGGPEMTLILTVQ
ncbi:MAG: VIT and VWA domain-containing protein [Anaerolineae bacterium]|jgi:Ca-activated chloride channel family protein